MYCILFLTIQATVAISCSRPWNRLARRSGKFVYIVGESPEKKASPRLSWRRFLWTPSTRQRADIIRRQDRGLIIRYPAFPEALLSMALSTRKQLSLEAAAGDPSKSGPWFASHRSVSMPWTRVVVGNNRPISLLLNLDNVLRDRYRR